MSIIAIKDLKPALAPGTRLIGIDQGEKTLGLALSNPDLTIATPLKTIARTKLAADLRELEKIIAEYNVGGIIIGLPRSMDGSEGPRGQSVRSFARSLADNGIKLPVAFWDERFSTSATEKFLIAERDMSRAKRNTVIDQMAAAYILEGALSFLSRV